MQGDLTMIIAHLGIVCAMCVGCTTGSTGSASATRGGSSSQFD
jgi:hypothetical protein